MVVSCRPDNLDGAADTADGLDDSLDGSQDTLATAHSNFVAANQWGSLDAGALVGNVSTWIGANREDSRWLRTAAQAFRDADGRGAALCYATNGQIASALADAGFVGGRADLTVSPSVATGGPLSTGYANDPVSAASGNFVEAEVDLGFGPTLGWLQVRRTYNSLDGRVGPFGPGWSSWASTRLRLSPAGRVAHLSGPDGQEAQVHLSPGTARGTAPGFEGRIERDGDGGLVARFPREGSSWRFDTAGRPVEIDGGPGARVALEWDGERLVRMRHERGRWLRFAWDGDRIAAAFADDGRRVAYTYDADGRLVAVAGPLGARRYEWDRRGRLAAVADADGVVAARNRYDATGRVLVQETPFGRRVRFSYRAGLVTEVDDEQGGPLNTYVHDEDGRLARVVDGHGEAVTTLYGDGGQPVAVTDRRGATTEYSWDAAGNCTRVARPDGTVVTMAWDEQHRCVGVTGPGGAACRFAYEGDERTPSTIEDPEGGVTRLDVSGGLVRRIVDPDGVSVAFEHDAEGRVVAATDGAGATRHYEWDATGQLAAAVSPLGHRLELQRDPAGRLVGRREPDGALWRLERSPAGRVVAAVDPTGARRELRYGSHGNVVEDVDPGGGVTAHRWNEHGSLVGTVMPDGGKWTVTHDALLRVVGVTDPAGATWLREHDAEGALVGTVTPTGVRRSATVDPNGLIAQVDDGLASVAFEYDEAGRAVARVRPDGSAAHARYDRCGRLVAVTEPGGGTTRFEHSPAGRLVATVGPNGGRVTFAYDDAGRLREIVDAAGGRRRLRHDADGRVVRVTGPTGETTRYAYDAAARVVAVAAPDGGVTSYAYDPAGRVVAVTGPDGGVTRTAHDAAGRLVTVVDPNGGELRLERDVAGRVVAEVDPTGARTELRLDEMGRPVEVIDPLGRVTRSTYDAAGRLVGRVDPAGARRWWRWDDSDRLAAWGVDGAEIALRRDLVGRVARIERDGEVVVTRRWDADGNLVGETTAAGTATWARDAVGNVVAATLERPGLPPVTTAYEHDAAGRVVAVDDPALGRTTIARDAAGRPVQITGGDLVERRTWEGDRLVAWSRARDGVTLAAVRFVRDAAGRVVEEHRRDAGEAERRVRYHYDAAGQLIGIDDAAGPRRFSWDAAGRLVQETGPTGSRRFRYDAAGQLTDVAGLDGEVHFEWDACGRRTAEVGPHGARRYEWDALGQLGAIHSTAADGSARTRTLTHDPLGRLAAVDGTPVVWDSAGPFDRLWAVGDRRLAGAGPVPGAVVDPSGTASWRATDARGEPGGLDPWGAGVPGAATGADLPGQLGLGHRGELTIDGLVWLRARALDPATRSFVSPDPFPGLAGQPWATNPYEYAANDPIGHADPAGLQPLTDVELQDIRDNWDRGAWDRYGGYIVAGALIVGGVALMATGVGGILGGALIGAAFSGAISAGTQQYFTGGVNWGRVGTDMLIGAASGGAGAWAGGASASLPALSRFGVRAGTDIFVNTAGGMGSRALYGENPFDARAVAFDVVSGGAGAGVGAGADAVRHGQILRSGVHLDAGGARAISVNPTNEPWIRQQIGNRPLIMSQTAAQEYEYAVNRFGTAAQKADAEAFMRTVTVVPDNPSARFAGLTETNSVGRNDMTVFGTADQAGRPIATSDMKFLSGTANQGVPYNATVHPTLQASFDQRVAVHAPSAVGDPVDVIVHPPPRF